MINNPPWDPLRTLGIVLLQSPRRVRFLISKVPLFTFSIPEAGLSHSVVVTRAPPPQEPPGPQVWSYCRVGIVLGIALL